MFVRFNCFFSKAHSNYYYIVANMNFVKDLLVIFYQKDDKFNSFAAI